MFLENLFDASSTTIVLRCAAAASEFCDRSVPIDTPPTIRPVIVAVSTAEPIFVRKERLSKFPASPMLSLSDRTSHKRNRHVRTPE
jgi:hypothetical protein